MNAYSLGAPVLPGVRRLHLNEYRYAHAREVWEAAAIPADDAVRRSALAEYPAGPDPALAEDLARYIAMAPGAAEARAANVALTAGSDEALRAVVEDFRLRGGRAVLLGVPSYSHFEQFARAAGLEVVAYPVGLGTPAADLEASLRYYAPRLAEGCLVYLCSPNNPTGDLWGAARVDRLAADYPASTFLVDEAYTEFAAAREEHLFASGEHLQPEDEDPPGCGSSHDPTLRTEFGDAGPPAMPIRDVEFGLSARRDVIDVTVLGLPWGDERYRGTFHLTSGARVPEALAALLLRTLPAGDAPPSEQKYELVGGASPELVPLAHRLLNAASAVGVALARPNVVVSRTLSKAFGLAALRVGYAVGATATVHRLAAHLNPKALGSRTASVARAALARADYYWQAACAARREGRLAVEALQARGWRVWPAPANFFLVAVGDGPALVCHLLEKGGVRVRDRGDQPGLAGFVRVTAGTPADTRALLAAFEGIGPPALVPQTLHTPKGVVAEVKRLVRETVRLLWCAEGDDALAWQARLPGDDLKDAPAPVEVWAQSGTMLGMYRHRTALFGGGMIPTDDDADLAYLRPAEGPDPLAAHVGRFRAAGFALQRNRTGAYWQVGSNALGAAISPVHVDVFSYTFDAASGRYLLDDPRFRAEDPGSAEAHCNTSYAPDELFPLSHEYRFYDLAIPMPAKAGEVLRRALGPDCMEVARARTPEGLAEFRLADLTPA